MCETGKNDCDDQLSKEEKEWRAGDVQNPFIDHYHRKRSNKIERDRPRDTESVGH